MPSDFSLKTNKSSTDVEYLSRLPRFEYLFLGIVETLENPRSVAPHACCRYHVLIC